MVLSIAGYSLDPPFSESTRTIVCRGRNAEGRPVVVKAVTGAALTAANVASMRHEHRMLSAVRSPYVPEVVDFNYKPGSHVALVMEDIGAAGSLERFLDAELDLTTVLEIAIATASALEAVHRQGITHYDVKPRNLIWAPNQRRLQLVDFGLAMRLEADDPQLSGHEDLVGTLPYISPEQTGRMNCRVDHRSDLYSLGVVLYRLLAGQLPFAADDVLGWVHAHLAATPTPLRQRVPNLPAPLAAITERLLEKDRERRYQSAGGVLADLRECARQLATSGTIASFELGRVDHSDHFYVPEQLYGRSAELERLLAAVASVGSEDRAGLVLISGPPGIGKSHLVGELQRPLALRNGTLIAGKFDLLERSTPLTGIVGAFEDAVRHLLKLEDRALAGRRDAILSAVGANARVLTDLVPALELVLGPQPIVAELGGVERLNRLKLTVERFVGALARREHPLVLFLDDLQWVDPASLALLEHLLSSSEMGSVLIIGSYRSGEVDDEHPLRRVIAEVRSSGLVIHELELGPLAPAHVESLLADTLRAERSAVAEIAALVHEKAGGNPFFIRQFLRTLHRQGVVEFDRDRAAWTWDIERARAVAVTDNVGDLLAEQIGDLSSDTRQLLLLAACIGARFDLRTLATVAERDYIATFVALWPALERRMIFADASVLARLDDAHADIDDALGPEEAAAMSFRFRHDRIQQAAASLTGVEDRRELRLQIGRTLMRDLGPQMRAARAFEIADQLNSGRELITDVGERRSLIELNLACGRRAIASAAYESAREYLSIAAELLGQGDAAPELWFDIHLELARSCCLSGRYADASREYPELLDRARDDAGRLAVYGAMADQSTLTATYADGVRACRAAFMLLDAPLPEDAAGIAAEIDLQMAEIEAKLAERDIASLLAAPTDAESEYLLMLQELDRLTTITYLASDWSLYTLAALRMTNISLSAVVPGFAALAFGCFSLLSVTQGRYDVAQEFGKVAIALADRDRYPRTFGRTYVTYFAMPAHYHFPLRELPSHFYRAYPTCLESGDLTYAGYLLLFGDHLKLAAGAPLAEIRDEVVRHLPFFLRSAPISMALFYGPYIIANLCALTGESPRDFGVGLDEQAFLAMANDIDIVRGWYDSGRLKRATITCTQLDFASVVEWVGKVELGVVGQFHVHEAHYYGALQLAGLLRGAELDAAQREQAEALRMSWTAQLETAEVQYPANFRAMVQLVHAEQARVRGLLGEAIAGYEAAIAAAREQSSIDQEALARRLFADFWLERSAPSSAVGQARAAIRCYSEWGAVRIVALLEQRYPEAVRHERALPDSSVSSASSGAEAESEVTLALCESSAKRGRLRVSDRLDLETVTRAARAISSETSISGLLGALADLLGENLGASRCLILRRQADAWEVVAVAGADPDMLGFSTSVANYVSRTGEFLVVDNPARSSRWSDDPHLHVANPRSLLCAPIRLEDRTLALVYAENSLTARAFTEDHLTLLHTVLAQAAISLDNARLFDALAREQALWHSLVDNAADLIVLVDRELRVEFVNRSSDDFVLSPTVGWKIEDSFTGEARTRVRAAIEEAFLGNRRSSHDSVVEGPRGPRYVTIRVGPVRKGDIVDHVSLIITDVSERRALADQLRQSQKMEAVGTLAGGIAHDFNNLLTVILGACELGCMAKPDAYSRALFQEITEASERATTLTRKLLAFSRKQVLRPEVIEVDGLIGGLTRLLGRMLGEDVVLETSLDAGARVSVDPSELEQVIVNLATNARDAMPRGGRLWISTQRIEHALTPMVVIEVRDSGVGMDAQTQERIFEPFFTTKPPGKGTGLGLSMVHGIIEQSGGRVEVESAPGRGARFRMFLPEHRLGGGEAGREVDPLAMPSGSETILLVEDDERLRGLVVTMLERLGYRVIAAATAESALALAHGLSNIDLLLTDVVMPGLSGPALAEQLRATRPELEILFTSGYTDDAIVRHGVAAGTVALLPKPFSIPVLARKVREVLDGRG